MKILIPFVLGLGLAAVPLLPASAAPALKVGCTLPNRQHIVRCTVRGRGFHAHERFRLTYRVTFLDLVVHGKNPQKVYMRTGTTDGHGAFTRPSLGFGVQPGHASFRLKVSASGARGDAASVSYFSLEN